jgi:hypothetical protein
MNDHRDAWNVFLSRWERAGARAGAALLLAAALPAAAQDQATIDRTQIIGNRELPKVLYIVPWKKPQPGDLAGRPLTSVVDEALAPIDRDVFRRQVRYDQQPGPQTSAPAAPPSVAPAR